MLKKFWPLICTVNELGDFGANEVKKFIVNRERKLKALNVAENNLTDNAAKDFAAALKHSNCKLESLDLQGNKFTDNAAKDFAEALKHSNCKLSLNVHWQRSEGVRCSTSAR